MSNHFSYFPSDNVVVTPYNAQYSYPSQANKSVKMTPRIPPKNGTNFAPGQQIRLEFPAQGYVNPANTFLVMDVVLVAPTNAGAYAVRFQNSIQSIINRVTLKYGGGPQEDLLQYGLLVRILTETTSTGQNNNVNQMGIADGIGGTCTGTLMSNYAAAVAVSSVAVVGTVCTITVASGGTVFKPGQYLTFSSATINGILVSDEYFQVLTSTATTITIEVPAGTIIAGTGTIIPIQAASGLLNTRQSQIQGLASAFLTATLGTAADDSWQESRGPGSGFVPNNQAALPGGMTAPTTPYSVRRYMINFALGTFTQDKLLPTKWLASQLAIEITLELSENCIYQPVGLSGNTTPPRYMVGNVALIPEIIEFDDKYDEDFLANLEAGGV